MQLSTESALLTAAGRIRRVASIEGLVSLAMVLTVYLWPSSDHGGPDNLVIIIWIAVAAGLGKAAATATAAGSSPSRTSRPPPDGPAGLSAGFAAGPDRSA